jgi:hypothetical protein
MSKLQFLQVAILVVVFSSLSTYRITARPSTSLSEKQLISQTTGTEETETIKGEITEIENDVVKVQTSEGQIEEIIISETEQQQLGLKPGTKISVTINNTTSGEESVEKVMLEEESASTIDTTDNNGASTTSTEQITEVQTEPQTTTTTGQPQPVPALW